MANRVELSEEMLDQVVGGTLLWGANKTVTPKDNPNAVYKYKSFTKCMQWLDANWDKAQDASCLQAMAAAGLVTYVGNGN